jgi:lipopolysaccharide/colanic/teichoic acid biosynthesis glycosyltransferase
MPWPIPCESQSVFAWNWNRTVIAGPEFTMIAIPEARVRGSVATQVRPVLQFSYNLWLPRVPEYARFKSAFDVTAASFMLFFSAPVLLLAALLVKLTSRGPAFYTQTRLGQNGQLFRMFKLRTMTHECERTSGVRWATKNDPRVTPLGRLLRATHIDELPQLWNVVQGEMSLVGPRPERPEFLPQLEASLPHYRCRLLVRPGLTGLAQVQLPPDSDLNSVRRKLAHDLHYVQHHDWRLDVQILLATLAYLTKAPTGGIRHLLGLPGGAVLERAYTLNSVASSPRRRPVAATSESVRAEPALQVAFA